MKVARIYRFMVWSADRAHTSGRILFLLTTIFLFFTITACRGEDARLEAIYSQHGLSGSFILYDLSKDKFHYVNPDRADTKFLPCSTFKITNSLIALQEGVVDGPEHLLKWDGNKRDLEAWNRDHTMRSAMRYSVVWYYQELARRIGPDRMRAYLSKMNYGNDDISTGIDKFWLEGEFRVSPREQMVLLRRLYADSLPFSKRAMQITRDILPVERGENYEINAKTGLCRMGAKTVGWWMGQVRRGDSVYLFVNNIEAFNPGREFLDLRLETTREILRKLRVVR